MADETVLVTGGSGFVGYHVIKILKQQQSRWILHGMSRQTTRNRIDGVEYHAGSVSLKEDVETIFRKVRPTIIVHTACPPVSGPHANERSFFQTNVSGTDLLLDQAVNLRTVKVFIFTSSVLVVEGDAQHQTTEDAPVRTLSSQCDEYSRSKAIAESIVLAASGVSSMLTTCLRLPATYGERDEQVIGEGMKALQRQENKIQIGSNTNLCDWLSAENAAQAHLLAIRALLVEYEHPQPKSQQVAGETFFITDGDPLPFWDHFRLIWKAAGDKTSTKQVKVIPVWFIMSLAAVIEVLYWAFTFGTRQPKTFRRQILKFTFLERTFSIEKARQRLGYIPQPNRDCQIKAGVSWYLDQQTAHTAPIGEGART